MGGILRVIYSVRILKYIEYIKDGCEYKIGHNCILYKKSLIIYSN